MANNNTTPAPREIKMKHPENFDGDRSDTLRFLGDVSLYFGVNDDIYDTDNKKISFVLSYMNGGTAGPWKLIKINAPAWGTYDDFIKELKKAFEPSDLAGEARSKMKYLRQTGTADEYIAEFRTLVSNTNITEDEALIEYFMEGISPKLVEKIYALETVPTTMADWYKHASRLDNQWRRGRAIVNRYRNGTTDTKKKFNFTKKYEAPRYTNYRDPNAMDTSLGRLTQEERNEHMKKGLCFKCHQSGHRASDHDAGPTNKTYQKPNTFQPRKPSGSDTYAKIRAMMADLEGDDKEDVLKKMEEEGF